MNQTVEFIKRIYESGKVVGRSGKAHKVHSMIDAVEGEFILDIIRNDPDIKKTLEVGCAYGLSSLYICAGIQGRNFAAHTIIDPSQNTKWDSAGIMNLRSCGIDFFKLIEERSEFALPMLLKEAKENFDLIFIDGWHTFDHVLLDCFYATALLRIGGYLVIDDASFPSIARLILFLKNYPCYTIHGKVIRNLKKSWKKLAVRFLMSPIRYETWVKILSPSLIRKIFEQPPSMVAFKKIAEDNRDWSWHNDAW